MSVESAQNGDSSVENRLLALAKSKQDGISNDDVKDHMPDVSLSEITAAINKCLKNGYNLNLLIKLLYLFPHLFL